MFTSTGTGIQQARQLALKLKKAKFDRIFISELKRTQQTAEIVNEYHNVEMVVDARLNDGKSGFEGRPYKELCDALDSSQDRWTTRFNDGESFTDIRARAKAFVADLRSKDYQAVLIITSAWILQAIIAEINSLSFDAAAEIDIEQGSFKTFELN